MSVVALQFAFQGYGVKIGLRSHDGAEERLKFAQQIGADGASVWAWACPGYTERCHLTVGDVLQMRERFARYTEVFPHQGDGDMAANLRALREVGYEGYIVPDHHFGFVGDDEWKRCSRAWQVGYLRGMMQALGI